MRRVPVAAGTLAVATVTTIAVTASPAQAEATREVVLNQGHADVIGVAYEDGELHLHVHAEQTEAEHEPGEVTVQVLPPAETTVPDDPAYAFLGEPGDPVWILPQAHDPELLFAGLAAEEVQPGDLVGDQVTVSVKAVFGPGEAAIYTENALGLPDQILLDSGDGTPDSFTLDAGTHIHANWAFTEPGNYWWLVTATARDAETDQRVSSGPALYHFQVLD